MLPPMPMRAPFQSPVKQRRVALYLTRVQLADLAGITVRTLYSVEEGATTPTEITRQRISDALDRAEQERSATGKASEVQR